MLSVGAIHGFEKIEASLRKAIEIVSTIPKLCRLLLTAGEVVGSSLRAGLKRKCPVRLILVYFFVFPRAKEIDLPDLRKSV